MSEAGFYGPSCACGAYLITRAMLIEEIDREWKEDKELRLAAFDSGHHKYKRLPCSNHCGRDPWPLEARKEMVDKSNYDSFENIRVRLGGERWS